MSDVLALTRSMLGTSVDRWAAISRVDAGLLARQPAPGEWSAIQALQHVVDTEAIVFRARVLAILYGQDFEGFDPDTQGHVDDVTRTAPELVAQLAPMRAASLETLASLTAADLPRTAIHAELGEVTMAQLLNEWAAHDTMHIVQAERAMMQAFIPGSGPWRAYFEDHDVELKPTGR
jgi:hypothetical protein